jgi:Protein of unknown function (DUF4007)
MTATARTYYFSGHETFPFRYPWLKKGFDAVEADGEAFLRDDAIAVLGVGKNMVRSIRHWCLTAGIVQEVSAEGARRSGSLEPTLFGRRIFATGDGLDPYLEDPTTLWLIHWKIASNQSRANTWHWTFSHFNEAEFTLATLSEAVYRWARTLPGKKIAPSSIHRDAECFLLTYVGSRHPKGAVVEDSLDCPLVELGLIKASPDHRSFRFQRGPQEDLPDGVLLYAIRSYWQVFNPHAETLSVADLSRQPGSPGRLFKIDESSLISRLEQVEAMTDGTLSYRETAGIRQLYRRKIVGRDSIDLLEAAYTAGTRSPGVAK